MNKLIITITIIIIYGLIGGFTKYKEVNEHNDKLITVKEKEIIEKAKTCINEKKCLTEKITLKTLYDLGYLEKQVNPITKEYYNEESYITLKNKEYVFIEIN